MIPHVDRCRVCGCTVTSPCVLRDEHGEYECSWMDLDHTLCSNPLCVALVPLVELMKMPIFRLRAHG